MFICILLTSATDDGPTQLPQHPGKGRREGVIYPPIQVISSEGIWILIHNNVDDPVDGSSFPGFFSPFLQ